MEIWMWVGIAVMAIVAAVLIPVSRFLRGRNRRVRGSRGDDGFTPFIWGGDGGGSQHHNSGSDAGDCGGGGGDGGGDGKSAHCRF